MLDEEKHLIHSVAEDLGYLRDEWNQVIDDSSVRRGSVVLRRLVVADELGKAWRALQFHGEPTIPACDLMETLKHDGWDSKKIHFAHVGAGSVTIIGGGRGHLRDPLPPTPVTRDFSLSQFRYSPSLIVSGTAIIRDDLIKYVANTLGGAHLGSGGKKLKPETLRNFKLLDSIRESYGLRGRPAIYFALLAIGQSVGEAPDMQALIERAEESPQPFDSLRTFRQHSKKL